MHAQNCALFVFGVVSFDSEKMVFLEIFDMYLIILVISSQYIVIYSFVNIWNFINRGGLFTAVGG